MSAKPAFPVPRERAIAYVLRHPAIESLPAGQTTFSVWIDRHGEPSVESAMIRFLWPDDFIPTRSREFAKGAIVVDLDKLDRIVTVEASAYIAGPSVVPDVVAEHNGVVASGTESNLLTAVSTVMVNWSRVDALLKRMAKETPNASALAKQLAEKVEQGLLAAEEAWDVRRGLAEKHLAWVMR